VPGVLKGWKILILIMADPETEEIERPKAVHVRRMHKKTTKQELVAFGQKFGNVKSVNVWYGFGQGVIEYFSTSEAAAAVAAQKDSVPLVRGKEVELGFGIPLTNKQRFKEDIRNPDYVSKEVRRCVNDILNLVCDKEARQRAQLLREQHNALLKQHRADEAGDDKSDICWEWVMTGGRCYRGRLCRFRHEVVPIHLLPSRFRWYSRRDNFPASREGSPYKNKMNAILSKLIDTVPNKTGVVLDGSTCSSVRAFAGGEHDRGPKDITVPNVCTESFLAIRDTGLCQAYHGSLRALLDSSPTKQYGFLYLDYCCCLTAGRNAVEKSPIQDVTTLFRHAQCDRTGCILCLSFAAPDPEKLARQVFQMFSTFLCSELYFTSVGATG